MIDPGDDEDGFVVAPEFQASRVSTHHIWYERLPGPGSVQDFYVFRMKLDPSTITSKATPSTHTMAAPIGKSTLAVSNRLTRLQNVAIPQPITNRARKEFVRYAALTAGTT